jgi:hypothetical protein
MVEQIPVIVSNPTFGNAVLPWTAEAGPFRDFEAQHLQFALNSRCPHVEFSATMPWLFVNDAILILVEAFCQDEFALSNLN